jgi:hypothetical protein
MSVYRCLGGAYLRFLRSKLKSCYEHSLHVNKLASERLWTRSSITATSMTKTSPLAVEGTGLQSCSNDPLSAFIRAILANATRMRRLCL